MGKSSKENRSGYTVGVFKDGKIKSVMKLNEAGNYIKEKSKKIRENRPKRECTSAQLEALAKGREIREKNRGSSSSSSSTKKEKKSKGGGVTFSSANSSSHPSAPRPKTKNIPYAKDSKVKTKSGANKARVRREKEMAEGKHRKGGDSQYNSDSDHSDRPSMNGGCSDGDED